MTAGFRNRRSGLALLCSVWTVAGCGSAPPQRIAMAGGGLGVEVTADGVPFATYRVTERRPVLWPLCGPLGVELTRAFPFRAEGSDQDHPHHESFWFAHGDVNGVDFWQGGGRIELEQVVLDEARGRLLGTNSWRDAAGREVCRDHHMLRFAATADRRTIDFEVTVLASAGPLRFGDTKEGTFALRLRREFRLTGPGATGAARNSESVTGPAVWGKQAAWIAYAATIDGQPFAVAILDHPDNPRHPTRWHARDYGLVAANPFGLKDFTGAPAGSGDLLVQAGGTLRFRYRVLLWRDALDRVDVEAAFRAYARGAE